MPPVSAYRDLVARLARRQQAVATERARIADQYARERAEAQRVVDRATDAVARASMEVDAARSTVEHIDLEAHQLWRLLEDRVGPLGKPPEATPPADPDDDPDLILQKVSHRLDQVRRGRPELPSWASPLLVVLGVLGAGAGYALAYAARWAALRVGGDFEVFAPVLKQIVVVLAPFLGLIPAKVLADRGDARLHGGAVGVVLVAGLCTLGALLLVLG